MSSPDPQVLDYQDSMEFQAARDPRGAREAMGEEVEKLLLTLPPDQRPAMEEEINGFRCFPPPPISFPFRRLFDKFVSEPGPSVQWSRIQELPKDSILDYNRSFQFFEVEQESPVGILKEQHKIGVSVAAPSSLPQPAA